MCFRAQRPLQIDIAVPESVLLKGTGPEVQPEISQLRPTQMGSAQALLRNRGFLFFSTLLIVCVAAAPPSSAQNTKSKQQQERPWAQELNKYPGLSEEFGRLFVKIQQTVQFPAPRKESRLLPLAPKSSLFYAAIPNYGEVASRVLKVFREELQESKPLRDWWTHGQWAAEGPKVEDALDKFAQLHQYLGDEIVISVTMEGTEPTFLVSSETHQPGLKNFLQQATEQMFGKSKPGIRILDPQELAEAKAKTPGEELLLLVRPDFIAAATDITALRSFNARVNAGNREFAATPFGKRVLEEYRGGTTVMAAADMQKILEKSSPALKQSEPFRQSGFSEMQYLVWDHATLAGKQISQMELSFSSPRHGAAAWLAKPRPLGSLDFVSPKAIMASTFVLSDPAQILEDVKALAGPSNTAAFAAIPAVEQGLNLSVKDDLLGLLGGEITMELDSFTPSQPAWRLILSVKDSNHLQQTLNAITAATHLESSQEDDGGVTYYSLRVPSGKTTTQIVYAQMNGYMVMGPTHDAVADSLRLHRSGDSLAKSKRFVDSLPPGNSSGASALFYEDPFGLVTTQLKSQRPDLVESLAPYTNAAPPIVMSFYGEESAIREVSAN